MPKILSVYFFIITLFLSEVALAEPFILNLFESVFSQSGSVDCWKEGKFNDQTCLKSVHACSFATNLTGAETGKVSIDRKKGGSESYNIKYFLLYSQKEVSSYSPNDSFDLPRGEELIVYKSKFDNRVQEIAILGKVKVEPVTTLSFSPQQGQKVSVILPQNRKAGERFGLRIYGETFRFSPAADEASLILTPGDYHVEVIKYFQETPLESKWVKFKIVTVPTNGVQKISISNRDFKPAGSAFAGTVAITPGSLKISSKGELNNKGYIFGASSVMIPAIGKENLAQYFSVIGGELSLNEDGAKKFLPLKLPTNLGTVRVSGECGTVKSKDYAEYEIFSDQTGKEKLGSIKIAFRYQHENIEVYFTDKNGKSKDASMLFARSSCGDSDSGEARKTYVDYVTKKVEGNWGRLGKGPWGDFGWIKASSIKLFDYSGSFSHGFLMGVTMKLLPNGKIKISGLSYQSMDDDENRRSKNPVDVTMDQDFMWDMKGNFTLDLNC